jgi:putative membrane protein
MIVRPKPTLWDVMFTLKGSIAQTIAIRLVVITFAALLVTLFSFRHPDVFSRLSAGPFTLIGLSLSIFMSFRNNACYDRWWEGRKQWGLLIVEVRALIRETAALGDAPDRVTLLRAVCGFSHALAARLREADEAAAAVDWLPPGDRDVAATPNPTDAVLGAAGAALDRLVARGLVSDWRYTVLEARLVGMSGVQAACERIRGTPLPFAYTLLLHRTAYLFCGLLPFGLAHPLGWATPLVTAIVSYTFFGLDALGDELEQPFGFDVNDLPLVSIVRVIERDIRAALGEVDLPPVLQPVDFLLR